MMLPVSQDRRDPTRMLKKRIFVEGGAAKKQVIAATGSNRVIWRDLFERAQADSRCAFFKLRHPLPVFARVRTRRKIDFQDAGIGCQRNPRPNICVVVWNIALERIFADARGSQTKCR